MQIKYQVMQEVRETNALNRPYQRVVETFDNYDDANDAVEKQGFGTYFIRKVFLKEDK